MEQIHFDRLHKEFENFLRIFHQTIELFRERLAQRRFDFEHFDHIDRIDSICGIAYDQLECYLQHYEFIKNQIDFNFQNLRLKYAGKIKSYCLFFLFSKLSKNYQNNLYYQRWIFSSFSFSFCRIQC